MSVAIQSLIATLFITAAGIVVSVSSVAQANPVDVEPAWTFAVSQDGTEFLFEFRNIGGYTAQETSLQWFNGESWRDLDVEFEITGEYTATGSGESWGIDKVGATVPCLEEGTWKYRVINQEWSWGQEFAALEEIPCTGAGEGADDFYEGLEPEGDDINDDETECNGDGESSDDPEDDSSSSACSASPDSSKAGLLVVLCNLLF